MEVMFYEAVFKEFNEKGIEYLVVGGIAANLHGVPRATADLDLAVAIKEENLKKIVSVMRDLGFQPRLPVEIEDFASLENLEMWHREKNMQVFTFWNPKTPYSEIDIFIHNPIDFNELNRSREMIDAGDLSIPIVSLDCLIELKTLSDREQDRSDIAALEKIRKLRREND